MTCSKRNQSGENHRTPVQSGQEELMRSKQIFSFKKSGENKSPDILTTGSGVPNVFQIKI
jgi:hypothetical protein